MFSKPLRQLVAADIERVCAEAVQEDENAEFKRTLAAKGGKPDPWIGGADAIGDHARNDIVKEIVAFANAYGGTLVLGIMETTDKPARAATIEPLPRCHDLAERIRLICRDMIDPQVPRLDAVGVEAGDDGSGVVVVHVPRSRFAAHRHKGDWHCYQRHADRSEKMMSMREIQDLTLRVRQGAEEIEEAFSRARLEFTKLGDRLSKKHGVAGFIGFRMALVPMDPIVFDKVHGKMDARPTAKTVFASFGGERSYSLRMPRFSGAWRPIVRGSKCQYDDSDPLSPYREVTDSGLIRFQWFRGRGQLE